MIIKIKRDTFKLKNIISILVVFYTIMMSGTVLQIIDMSLLQTINMILTTIILLCLMIKGKKHNRYLKRLRLFLVLATISSVLIMLIWKEVVMWKVYYANLCLLIIGYLIVMNIDYKKFESIYINTIVIIATLSLLFYYFPQLCDIFPKIQLDSEAVYWRYEFFGVYARYISEGNYLLNRNIGIFWEPGMYQGFLVLALLMISLGNPKKYNNIKKFILMITILSTNSATGYILLGLVIYFELFNKIKHWKLLLQWILTSSIIILSLWLVFDINSFLNYFEFLPEHFLEKLTDSSNISKNTRLYGILSDLLIVMQNPIGVGIVSSDIVRMAQIERLGVTIDAYTNTSFTMMIYYGLFIGISYFIIIVRGCFKISRNKIMGLILLIIMLIIINTEPHYLTILFTTIFFYWYCLEEKVNT